MKEEIWLHRSQEWIKENPGKGTMYKASQPEVEKPKPTKRIDLSEIKTGEYRNPGIYAIICEKAKSVYVGQSKNMANRLRNHKMVLLSRRPPSKIYERMLIDIDNYGIESFTFEKHIDLKDHDVPNILEIERETMWFFLEKGYRLYNADLPIGNNAIYCPETMRDTIVSLIKECSNDVKNFELVKDLLVKIKSSKKK